jgi:uncharacterized surface protein with fasciclin (FAS1) repeats
MTDNNSTNPTNNMVPCVSYGFGSMMIPTQGTCSMMPESECKVPDGMVGAGRDAYSATTTCDQAMVQHQVKIRAAQLTVALADPKYKILAKLVGLIDGLADTLQDSAGSITILTPPDAAFNKLSDQLLSFLQKKDNKESKDILEKILKYHVIKNDATLEGTPLGITVPISTVLLPPDLDVTSLNIPIYKDDNDTTTTLPTTTTTTTTQALVPKWLQRSTPNNNWT